MLYTHLLPCNVRQDKREVNQMNTSAHLPSHHDSFFPPLLPTSPPPSLLRVYLNILPDVNMGAKDTVTQFKQTMDVLISKFATRLLKLNVDEVEVKVRPQLLPHRSVCATFRHFLVEDYSLLTMQF